MDATDEVKSRLSIEDVVGEYVQLKRAGRNWRGLSPWTSEKTPSLMISPDKQIWHDFSSGKGGNIFSFVMEMEGLDFKGALELLARKSGVDLDQYRTSTSRGPSKERLYELNELAAHFYQVQFTKNASALNYVSKTRKFTKETALEWRLGYSPNGTALMDYLKSKKITDGEIKRAGLASSYGKDMFRGRLMIPLADPQGRIIGFTARILDSGEPKYINTPSTVLYDKSRHVFGLHLAKEAIRKTNFVVLAEGNLDVIMSHQAGVKNVVATAGTALTEQHLKTLARFTTDLRLAFDADKAGLAATERAIPLASKVGVSLGIITIPSGKDPDELIKQDASKWQGIIEKPQYALDWLIDQYQERLDLKSAQGKRQFSDVLLPVVKQLTDKVEQDHYLNKLAEILTVSRESLADKMAAASGANLPRRKITELAKLTNDERQVAERNKIEEHLLAILLARPKLLKNASLITPEMLNPASQNIWKLIHQPGYKVPKAGSQTLHLDAMQDADEARTEAVLEYGEGALETATPQRAKTAGGVAGFARQQGSGVHSLRERVKILLLEYEELYQGLDESELIYEVSRLQARLIENYVKTRKTKLARELSSADEVKSAELLAGAKKLDNLLKQAMGETD